MCYPVCGMVHTCCYSKRVAREVAQQLLVLPLSVAHHCPQSFQPVLHDWCNKGHGMCYPVCGMVHACCYSKRVAVKWQQQLLVLPLSVVRNTVPFLHTNIQLVYGSSLPQSFQPVLHDWCNKGHGMCYPVCGMVHACCYSKRVAREVAAAASRSPSLWSLTQYPNRSSQCSTTGVTKAMVCVILCVGWCTLAATQRE